MAPRSAAHRGDALSTPGRGEVVWLLELDLGGGTHRYAYEDTTATSRLAGGEVIYRSGLEVGAVSLDSESVSISVRVLDIGVLAGRVGTFRGRPAALHAYRGEDYVEDAASLVGVVASVTWGDPGEPDRLELQIQRSGLVTSDICDPDHVVSPQTWGAGSAYDDDQDGFAYPRVLGHPGRQYDGSDVSPPRPAIPLCIVATAPLRDRGLFCAEKVEAAEVYWTNVTQATAGSEPVLFEEDDAGHTVALIDTLGIVSPGDEAYVGMSPRAGRGGGEFYRGRLVEGLGDLLLWGSDNFGLGNFDLPRIEAERDRLNRLSVDVVINELGLSWGEWVRSNILDQFFVEEVSGPRGTWYREVVWATTGTRSRAHLTVGTSTTSGGLPVVPAGPVEETSEDPANRITIAFAPRFSSGNRLLRQCTLAPVAEDRPAAGDWRFGVSPLCARSAELYRNRGNPTGVISRTFEVIATHDTATGLLLAQKRAERHALPHTLLTYSGSHELLDLPAYSEVLVTDEDRGIVARSAILLPGTVIEGRRATVRVRMPWA